MSRVDEQGRSIYRRQPRAPRSSHPRRAPAAPAPCSGALFSQVTHGDFPRKTSAEFLHVRHVTPSSAQTKRGDGLLVAPGQRQDRLPGFGQAPGTPPRPRHRSSGQRRMHGAPRRSRLLCSSSEPWHRNRAKPSQEEQRLGAEERGALSCPRNAAPALLKPAPSATANIALVP